MRTVPINIYIFVAFRNTTRGVRHSFSSIISWVVDRSTHWSSVGRSVGAGGSHQVEEHRRKPGVATQRHDAQAHAVVVLQHPIHSPTNRTTTRHKTSPVHCIRFGCVAVFAAPTRYSPSLTHDRRCSHARTPARTHARRHARMHARTCWSGRPETDQV